MSKQQQQPPLTDYEQIRNVIALYSISLDTKDWDGLDRVFTPDGICDYPSPPLATFRNPAETKAGLAKLLNPLRTQHNLSTQHIEITSPNTAYAVTYCPAYHWGTGKDRGKFCLGMGKYLDNLVKGCFEDGQEECWRIKKRRIAVAGDSVGDLSLLFPDGKEVPEDYMG